MSIDSNSITSAPSYDTIYGIKEAWNRLEYLTYKLENINSTNENEITCKVIQVIHELVRR